MPFTPSTVGTRAVGGLSLGMFFVPPALSTHFDPTSTIGADSANLADVILGYLQSTTPIVFIGLRSSVATSGKLFAKGATSIGSVGTVSSIEGYMVFNLVKIRPTRWTKPPYPAKLDYGKSIVRGLRLATHNNDKWTHYNVNIGGGLTAERSGIYNLVGHDHGPNAGGLWQGEV